MLYAVSFAILLGFVAFVALFPRHTARLKRLAPPFSFLNREIKIFNRMRMVVPLTNRQPTDYIRWLGRLHVNPRERCDDADPIGKLFYLYACGRLAQMSHDPQKRRQYYKNAVFTFGSARAKSKPCYLNLKLSKRRTLFALRQPIFKYFGGRFVTRGEHMRFSYSYIMSKTENGAEIKNYTANDFSGVEVFEIAGEHLFTHDFMADKMQCNYSQTADTFTVTHRGQTIAVYVQSVGRVTFMTTMADENPNLCVSVNVQNSAKIFLVKTDTKQSAQKIVHKIKQINGAVSYLLPHDRIEYNREIEKLYARAVFAPFITGEKLKNRFTATQKIVPTLNLPTLVYDVTDETELFAVLDSFDNFKTIAACGGNLNVVIMYSGTNDTVRTVLGAFANRAQMRDLIRAGIFIFFIDRVRAPNDAVYYLSKMGEATPRAVMSNNSRELIVVSRKAVSYSTTDPKTGVTKYHRLTPNQQIVDAHGTIIPVGYDAVTTAVRVISTPPTRAATVLSRATNRARKSVPNPAPKVRARA